MIYKASLPALVFLVLSLSVKAQKNDANWNSNSSMDPEKSIVMNAETSENHQTLLAAIKAADLEEVLNIDGPFTVFAPSDLAFENLSNKSISELLHPSNKKELHALMTYHIIAGKFSASKILKAMCRGGGRASFTTVQGADIVATMDGVDIVLTDSLGNSARITAADSLQSNGVIHEIDTVIQPSSL